MMRSGWAFIAGLLAALGLWAWWTRPSKAATEKGWSFDLSGEAEGSASEEIPSEPPPEAGRYWLGPLTTFGTEISDPVAGTVDSRVTRLEPTIRAASQRFSVPSDLLAAVLHRESRGDLTAVGDGGDSVGAGQVTEGAQQTVNNYFETDLRRENWVHNVFLVAGYLRYLYETMHDGWRWGLARPTNMWYEASRGYLCGKQGAESNSGCAATEAKKRLTIAGLQYQIPSS